MFTAQMECLLKRIATLIPEKARSVGITMEVILCYIEGINSTAPALPEGKEIKE